MVEHIVLLRWTEQASQEAIDSAVAEPRGLNGKIAGIVDLSCVAKFIGRVGAAVEVKIIFAVGQRRGIIEPQYHDMGMS